MASIKINQMDGKNSLDSNSTAIFMLKQQFYSSQLWTHGYSICYYFLPLFLAKRASRASFRRCVVRIAALLTLLACGLSFNITCKFFSGFFLCTARLGFGLQTQQTKPLMGRRIQTTLCLSTKMFLSRSGCIQLNFNCCFCNIKL